ncbi:MAG: hypothetical protein V4472_04865 [Pseudomonadota bacterium]
MFENADLDHPVGAIPEAEIEPAENRPAKEERHRRDEGDRERGTTANGSGHGWRFDAGAQGRSHFATTVRLAMSAGDCSIIAA